MHFKQWKSRSGLEEVQSKVEIVVNVLLPTGRGTKTAVCKSGEDFNQMTHLHFININNENYTYNKIMQKVTSN